MKLKEIEGIRVAPGETLVLIPPSPMPAEMQRRLLDHCDRTGINLLVLPHGSRVLVKERRPGSNPPAPAHRPAPPPNPPLAGRPCPVSNRLRPHVGHTYPDPPGAE